MEVDIYDFDKTIVPFDSGSKFVLFCALHYPWTLITLPLTGIAFLLAYIGIIDFTKFKKVCFLFVALIPLHKAVEKFWNKHEKDVFAWVKEKNRHRVIISASPDFLLTEIASRLDFDKLICSLHSSRTGAIKSRNCNKEEKVRRFYELYDKETVRVIDVYSDSLHYDKPIFSLAENMCYNIVDGKRIPFKYSEKYKD